MINCDIQLSIPSNLQMPFIRYDSKFVPWSDKRASGTTKKGIIFSINN